jgi:hypothetical protein
MRSPSDRNGNQDHILQMACQPFEKNIKVLEFFVFLRHRCCIRGRVYG